jgi:ATP-dependent DNA helicase RecG
MAVHLNTAVSALPGIGAQGQKDLRALGITQAEDLLFYVPFRYDDYSVIKTINRLKAGETVTVRATVDTVEVRPAARNPKITMTEAYVSDITGQLKVIWFNQPWLIKTLKEGRAVSLAGRVDNRYGLTLVNPVHEPPDKDVITGRILPVYGLTGSLSMNRMRAAVEAAMPAVSELEDWIPLRILETEGYMKLDEAVRIVHVPRDREQLAQAIERLKFNELFFHQVLFAEIRHDRKKRLCYSIPIDKEKLKQFVVQLPFAFTQAQRRAAWQIVKDLSGSQPMNRLLEGDVGSGKTVVAAMAIDRVVSCGYRVLYLAPTEILARQQQDVLQCFLSNHEIGLLTRSQSRVGDSEAQRDTVRQARCIVGTHALLQESFTTDEVALVVVDEQHRWGVKQRHALLEQDRKVTPHLLSMSATPIPRSLALTLYGDLDVSVIDQMPEGRIPVATAIVGQAQKEGMWSYVAQQIKNGAQAFVVCPLIDPSEKVDRSSVQDTKKRLLKGPLKGLRLEMLHGRMKSDEKEAIIRDFRDGKIDVLVCTTVVEVGVDIPGATIMIVLDAEKFGLAQLHQLRGRVGRSDARSYCYVLSGPEAGETAMERLRVFASMSDGFKLADEDLRLRGPGNLFGNAQSGFPDFQLATPADIDLMRKARDWALRLYDENPTFTDDPLIRRKIKTTLENTHLE